MTTDLDTRIRSLAALKWARELEKKEKTDPNTVNETLLAHQINDILESINFEKIRKQAEEGSKEYLDVARMILEQSAERTKRLKVELELKMYKENVAAQKQTMQETIVNEPGLSPATLVKLEAALAKL